MKRVLITGSGSYIGTSVETWLAQERFSGGYQVDTLDMQDPAWREKSFSEYDAVFHVAGIAHADIGKVTEEQKKLYYRVNCDLAVETAEKAKAEGVRQFIFMSSIIVYGEGGSVWKKRVITKETRPSPSNFYGDSKWQAEQRLRDVSAHSEKEKNEGGQPGESFQLAILRPPMIYGEGCRGNYQTLKQIALHFPIFPDFPNERSMLSIENLCEFVRRLIEDGSGGLYFPQNREYVQTAKMVKWIAREHGKQVVLVKGFNWIISLLSLAPGRIGKMVNKAFGSLVYEKGINKGLKE